MTNNHKCRACGSADVESSLDFGETPIAHRLLKAENEAEDLFPFALEICLSCGLIQVADPIPPELLYRGYNYNFSSWKPEPHLADEVTMITAHGVPASVCEIGANDGRFLEELRARGAGTCIAVEPNPVPGARARERGLQVIEGFFDAGLGSRIAADHGPFALAVARQVLEHAHDPTDFLLSARKLLAPGGKLFVDVPDFSPSATLGDCTTLWEEHVSYFTQDSLSRLLGRCGFEIESVARYDFSGGTLAVLARPANPSRESGAAQADRDEIDRLRRFAERFERYRRRTIEALRSLRAKGWTLAIYGAGVRASSACNMLGLGPVLHAAIDDRAERQGLFLPGARIPIVSAENFRPRVSGRDFLALLAVNNESESAVRRTIHDKIDPRAAAISLCGPADIWRGLSELEALAR